MPLFPVYAPVCVGRSTMKQYMPMKPVRRGFKVWVRADAVNVYFCAFDVYVGRPGDGTSVETGLGELRGSSTRSTVTISFPPVLILTTSINKVSTRVVPRIPTDLGIPPPWRGSMWSVGNSQWGNLVASVWMDKKPVMMLSTLAQPDVDRSAKRKQKDGTRETVTCSDSVVLYNKYYRQVLQVVCEPSYLFL